MPAPVMTALPDITRVACSWLRSQLLATVTVSPDLVGWTNGSQWVSVRRVSGQGLLWPPGSREDAVVDFDIRAGSREELADLSMAVRLALQKFPWETVPQEGAVVLLVDEESVVAMPVDPVDGHRAVVTVHLQWRAA